MPCYMFTWHAYGTWLPDREQGYVHWSRGLQETSMPLAMLYRKQQKAAEVELEEKHQLAILDELQVAAEKQQFRLHYAVCEMSHLHVLASWRDERSWKQRQRSIRHSISLRLNQFARKRWISRGGWASRVRDRRHFEHLVKVYLPKHCGWKWSEGRGLHR